MFPAVPWDSSHPSWSGPIQETFWTADQIRGSCSKRWSVQWRWQPAMYKVMLTEGYAAGLKDFAAGNPWTTHRVECNLATEAMARNGAARLRRQFPPKVVPNHPDPLKLRSR